VWFAAGLVAGLGGARVHPRIPDARSQEMKIKL